MQRLRVALLNAASDPNEAWANFSRDSRVRLTNYEVTAGELPAFDAVDAAIVTGSPASAYWDDDWIAGLTDWIRTADSRGIPLLGVCFGHQLLARALGGEVVDMGEYELGYHEVTVSNDSPLFEGFDRSFVAFCAHHDSVSRLPPNAVATARSPMALQGFRRGHSFGVQFHAEFDQAAAESAIAREGSTPDAIERAMTTVTLENVDAAVGAKRVFENFLVYAETNAGVTGRATVSID